MSLSVAIMAHPGRKAQVAQLLDRIGDVPVAWDQKSNLWDTRRRATLAYDPGCTHHLVLQDDVLVCRDLVAGVERALEYAPADVPLSLYIGQRRPLAVPVRAMCLEACECDASWVTMRTLLWGPAVIVPTLAIPEMVAYGDTLQKVPHDDRRVGLYWETQAQERCWYTWPSLVDHADGPSMVNGRLGTDRSHAGEQYRIAHNFIGEEASALDLDWTGPIVGGLI
jgi:hypothetical protein